jgi:hypothetical protein
VFAGQKEQHQFGEVSARLGHQTGGLLTSLRGRWHNYA